MQAIQNLSNNNENFYLDFGDFEIDGFNPADENETDELQEEEDKGGNSALVNTNPPEVSAEEQADEGGSSEDSNESNSSFKQIMERLDELGFAIPIIDEPVNAIKLLLGFEKSSLP